MEFLQRETLATRVRTTHGRGGVFINPAGVRAAGLAGARVRRVFPLLALIAVMDLPRNFLLEAGPVAELACEVLGRGAP